MKRLYDLANLVLLGLIGILVARSYPRLPARVPAHFNLAGQPDRWGAKDDMLVLFLLPAVIAGALYIFVGLVSRLKARAAFANIPHKAEFLRLPAEKQEIYWALCREFFTGLAAGMNLVFYLFIKGSIDVAMGAKTALPLKDGLPALGLLGVLVLFYFWRLLALPGKLVRNEV